MFSRVVGVLHGLLLSLVGVCFMRVVVIVVILMLCISQVSYY